MPSIEDAYRASGWNNSAAIAADIAAGHGMEKFNAVYGGSSGGGGNSNQSTGVTIPPFSFDYQAAEERILLDPNSELNKYYKQKLDEAGGDVKLAKVRIEEDYSQGKRYRKEDLATQLAEEKRTREQETRETTTDLNRRGILFGQIPLGQDTSAAPYSDIAQRFFLNPMTEKQQARKLAIERAISRQSEQADITKGRDVQDIDIAFPRYQKGLEQEKLTKYRSEILPYEYGKAAAKYGASFNPYLQGKQI